MPSLTLTDFDDVDNAINKSHELFQGVTPARLIKSVTYAETVNEAITKAETQTIGDVIDDTKPTQMTAILKAKAEEIGAFFIDAIRDEARGGWITDANNFLLPDGIHPNNDGHLLYGNNIIAAMLGNPPRL